ncbi:MAG TPA: XamI family restriction endonuclease [Candidatus Acidoferrales bacterium]|nr:XamI family restriction endonuclease [Candidatus Acidoferrales bacterium]
MAINADKPHLWKADTRASVDQFNQWFLKFAPKAYRETRNTTVDSVKHGLDLTGDLTTITPSILQANPGILPTLRMSTCPPLARDRLIGLADSTKNLVGSMEEGKIPPRLSPELLEQHLVRIAKILLAMRDTDVFPWIPENRHPTKSERYRSSTIVADRLCGAVADPIVRNAQEKRQLALIEEYLRARGYRKLEHTTGAPITEMKPGTFAFRLNVHVKPSRTDTKAVKIPVDAVIQPKRAKLPHLPVLIEAKSAGDFTNVNKRRKEEATKINQLKATFGEGVVFALFLCGYFDAAYLGYEAAEGIDWVWEHRIDELAKLGI